MKIKSRDKIKLGNDEFYTNLGIIGIDPDLGIYEGYDGYFGGENLSYDQKIELAGIMIGRWQEYKKKMEEGKYKSAHAPSREDHIEKFTEAIVNLLKEEIPSLPPTTFDEIPSHAALVLRTKLGNNSWIKKWIDWWEIDFIIEGNKLKFGGKFRSIYPVEYVIVEGSIKLRKGQEQVAHKVEVVE